MRRIGLWLVLIVCIGVVGWTIYLLITNASHEGTLALYPWPGGEIAPIWVLVATFVGGMLFIPVLRVLVRTAGNLDAARRKAAEARQKADWQKPDEPSVEEP